MAIQLKTLRWDELVIVTGGGGVGPPDPMAEPYLWTVFFKVDGNSANVTPVLTLSGSATMTFTAGSHGNLRVGQVALGQVIPVPAPLGQWRDQLKPIPVDPAAQPWLKATELPAVFGVVAVVLLHGAVTDDAAEAGHMALNAAIEEAINNVIGSLGLAHQKITQQDVASVTKGISDKVTNAIENHQTWVENLYSYFHGPDIEIGFATWFWSQDQLPGLDVHQDFSASVGGDVLDIWEIDGELDATRVPPQVNIALNATGSSDCVKSIVEGHKIRATASASGLVEPLLYQWTSNEIALAPPTLRRQLTFTAPAAGVPATLTVSVTDSEGTILQRSVVLVPTSLATAAIENLICEIDHLRPWSVPMGDGAALSDPVLRNPSQSELAQLIGIAENLVAACRRMLGSAQ